MRNDASTFMVGFFFNFTWRIASKIHFIRVSFSRFPRTALPTLRLFLFFSLSAQLLNVVNGSECRK